MCALMLTVYFEEPFWVGFFEREENHELSVCKVTFGAEPKDAEVWEFVLRRYCDLKFSRAVKREEKISADNPKRRQRNIKKQLQNLGVGTKSRQALSAMREAMKKERVKISKEQREAEKQYKYELRREKRKEKHRGR